MIQNNKGEYREVESERRCRQTPEDGSGSNQGRPPVKISLTGRAPRVSFENTGSADTSEHNGDRGIYGLGDVGSARRFSSWRY